MPRSETVRVSLGNVRQSPSTSASVVDTLARSQRVTLLYRKGNWYRVQLSDGALGWAHRVLFREPSKGNLPEKVVVEVSLGNVRRSPDMDSPVLARIERDQQLEVIDRQERWYHLRLPDGRAGWAHRSLFRTRSEAEPTRSVAKTLSGILREAPLPRSAVVDTLDQETVVILDERDEWLHVRLADGRTGWAPAPSRAPLSGGEAAWDGRAEQAFHQIKFIRVDVGGTGEERVLFLLDGRYPPNTFVLEEGSLRVVCDFPETRLAAGIGRIIPVGSRLIQRVHASEYRGDRAKVRAVVDLAPDKRYEVDQFFYEDQHVYSVVIREK